MGTSWELCDYMMGMASCCLKASMGLIPHPSLLLRAEVNPACQGMLSPLLKTSLYSMWEMLGNFCRAVLVVGPGVAVSALGQAEWGSVLCLCIICSMLAGLRTAQM